MTQVSSGLPHASSPASSYDSCREEQRLASRLTSKRHRYIARKPSRVESSEIQPYFCIDESKDGWGRHRRAKDGLGEDGPEEQERAGETGSGIRHTRRTSPAHRAEAKPRRGPDYAARVGEHALWLYTRFYARTEMLTTTATINSLALSFTFGGNIFPGCILGSSTCAC